MGGKDTARTAQGVGSRDSPDERTRVAGCMCRPLYGHLYLPPYFTVTCGQYGLPDLRIPVGKNLLPMEPEPPPDAARPDPQAGRWHACSLAHVLDIRKYTHDAAPPESVQGVRQPHSNLSIKDIHRRIGITSPVQAKPVPVAAGNAPGHRGDRNRLALAPSRQRTKTHSWKNKQPPTIFILSLPAIAAPALAVAVACHMYRTRQITRITDSQRDHRYREISKH